jgi:hypothetical protein
MARYYFDVMDDDVLVPDEEGGEFENDQSAAEEAALVLAEMAKARLPGSIRRDMSVRVRNSAGPLLRTSLSFTVEPLA